MAAIDAPKERRSNKLEPPLTCQVPGCKKERYFFETLRQRHVKIAHENFDSHACHICGMKLSSAAEARNHTIGEHMHEVMGALPAREECEEVFDGGDSYKKHYVSVHPGQAWAAMVKELANKASKAF